MAAPLSTPADEAPPRRGRPASLPVPTLEQLLAALPVLTPEAPLADLEAQVVACETLITRLEARRNLLPAQLARAADGGDVLRLYAIQRELDQLPGALDVCRLHRLTAKIALRKAQEGAAHSAEYAALPALEEADRALQAAQEARRLAWAAVQDQRDARQDARRDMVNLIQEKGALLEKLQGTAAAPLMRSLIHRPRPAGGG